MSPLTPTGAGLEPAESNRDLLLFESDSGHRLSTNLGSEGAFTLLTGGIGKFTLVSKIGCVLGKIPLLPTVLKYGSAILGVSSASDQAFSALDSLKDRDVNGVIEHSMLAVMDAVDALNALFQSCFVAGTPILTPDGSKPIEEFRPGDLVLSRSEHDPEGPVVPRLVEQVFIRTAEVWDLVVGGRLIRTTAEHPFWAEGRGWTPASLLAAGDRLATLGGDWTVVDGISPSGSMATVYNIRVAEYHTYFVAERGWESPLWSHNASGPAYGTTTTPEKFRGRAAKAWNWDHIYDAHSDFGNIAAQRGRLEQVFQGLTRPQIRARSQAAWANRKRILTQVGPDNVKRVYYEGIDPVSGQKIGFWYNESTGIVETAYPNPRR